MCRSIRVLYNFDPPTTDDEIRAAALQFVRKVSGIGKPSGADTAAFEKAVGEVAATTRRLLGSLHARTLVRTREGERQKAIARSQQREGRVGDAHGSVHSHASVRASGSRVVHDHSSPDE